jgi:hypothetical protein
MLEINPIEPAKLAEALGHVPDIVLCRLLRRLKITNFSCIPRLGCASPGAITLAACFAGWLNGSAQERAKGRSPP